MLEQIEEKYAQVQERIHKKQEALKVKNEERDRLIYEKIQNIDLKEAEEE